jgi:hypothetical protein
VGDTGEVGFGDHRRIRGLQRGCNQHSRQ